MPEHDARVAPRVGIEFIPWLQFAARFPRRSGKRHSQPAVQRQHAHARQRVDDETQSIISLELARPLRWSIAVHLGQEPAVVGSPQTLLDFGGALQGLFDGPCRQRTRVHHQRIELVIVVRQRTAAQPVDKFVEIRRVQGFGQRIEALRVGDQILRQRQQVQVMIAQDGNRGFAERLDEAQRLQ